MKKRAVKKALCLLLLCLLLSFSLCACGGRNSYPLVIENTGISKGLFAYYLDCVTADPKAYGVKENSRENVLSATYGLCKKYAAVQNFMKENKIKTEQYLKSDANSRTNGLWSLFKTHYKRIGVSKADVLSAELCTAGKKQIVARFFGKGGKNEVSQDELKQSFVELYVGFKAIEAPLCKLNTKGETIPLSEKEKSALEEQFESMAKRLRNGSDIDSLNAEYCRSVNLVATQALEVNLMKKGDEMYDDDFFEKVSAISHGSAGVIESGNSIYLVERCTIATNDEDAFKQYESEVLEYVKMPWVEKKINALAAKYSAKENKKAVDRIYKTVAENR